MLRASEKMMARKNNEKDVAKLLLNHGNIEFDARYQYRENVVKNRIDVLSLMVMPSKLWRFEWSDYFLVPKHVLFCQ